MKGGGSNETNNGHHKTRARVHAFAEVIRDLYSPYRSNTHVIYYILPDRGAILNTIFMRVTNLDSAARTGESAAIR
jgi:hypothetical protein